MAFLPPGVSDLILNVNSERRIKMNKYRLYILLICILTVACTDNFKEINTNKAGVIVDETGISLKIIQEGIYFNYDYGKGKNWPFQLMQNLNADMFCGYMHDYKPFNGGSNNSDYNLQDGWNGLCWENVYAYILPIIKKIEDSSQSTNLAANGFIRILKVELMHRVSDIYGPIIYSHFGDEEKRYLPDTQQEAYDAFFKDLDDGIQFLEKEIATQGEGFAPLKDYDLIFDGTCRAWIKFANSLRLRLAIRIAMAAPERGEEEFKKGMASLYGVMESADEIAAVNTRNGYVNPLGEINRIWEEVYMNASIESIMNGYEDPRRKAYFEPCRQDVILQDQHGKDSIAISLKGEYHGIRQGTCFAHRLYASHSKLYVNQDSPAILMTASEVWFLRAEAALRGWTAENIKKCYEKGIVTSFEQWNISGSDTYLQSDKLAADYMDVYTPSNNITARCQVSPQWLDDTDRETKLEKIITQKWLAVFPEGYEAWAEHRRTGYPRIFPVKINNSKDGSIDTQIMIRRLNFPGSVKSLENDLYKRLVTALGGADHGGTRLWWDTGKNF